MHLILFLLGIISICYFLCIAFFVGHGTNFFFIWLLIGIGLITFAALLRKGFWTAHFPLWLRRTFTALVCIGFALFLFVQGFILSGFFQKGPEGLDYVVVLGAQMKTSGPSKALKYRLDEAVIWKLTRTPKSSYPAVRDRTSPCRRHRECTIIW